MSFGQDFFNVFVSMFFQVAGYYGRKLRTLVASLALRSVLALGLGRARGCLVPFALSIAWSPGIWQLTFGHLAAVCFHLRLGMDCFKGLFPRTSTVRAGPFKRAHLGLPAFQSLYKDKTIEQDRGRLSSPLRPGQFLMPR